jgi:hypothetical protein
LAPDQPYEGLLRYFLRTKQLVEQRGPPPTSRQEARARERQAPQGQHAKQQQQQQQQAVDTFGQVGQPEADSGLEPCCADDDGWAA